MPLALLVEIDTLNRGVMHVCFRIGCSTRSWHKFLAPRFVNTCKYTSNDVYTVAPYCNYIETTNPINVNCLKSGYAELRPPVATTSTPTYVFEFLPSP